MKILLYLIPVFMFFSFNEKERHADTDKEALLAYYQKTFDDLSAQVAGLTEEQMKFKPSAESWSVSQCLEHIVATEKMLFTMVKDSLSKPGNPERRSEVKVTDQQVINGMSDRSFKAKAPPELQPKGTYTNPKDALADLQKYRKVILEYINQASVDNLRNHVSDSPFGPIDGYHSLLFIAGHSARHTLQIAEVKSNEKFPK